jgi:transcription elongation GreA/GreB family factor
MPVKNYITPIGLERLKDEHRFLLTRERLAVVEVVAWAAGNAVRSENADYRYGKRRLRQIDGRIRFLASESKPRKPRTLGRWGAEFSNRRSHHRCGCL